MTPEEVRAKSNANLKHFKPGQSGNPLGRPAAGLSIREEINRMADYSEDKLRKVARDKSESWNTRVAAERMICALEYTDLKEFERVITGEETLREAAERGINTEVVKKLKRRTRTTKSEGGDPVTETEVEIELHDRAAQDFDRVVNQTAGRPKETVEVQNTPISEESQQLFGILHSRYNDSPKAPDDSAEQPNTNGSGSSA